MCVYPDGSKYKGHMVKGLKDGPGVYEYANGDKYDGDWKEDKKQDREATFTYANGDVYVGWWNKG